MDPLTLMAISAAVSLGTGGIAKWLGDAKDAEETRQREAALQQYVALQPPQHRDLVARQVVQAMTANVRRNPALSATQDEALARTMEVARNGQSARGAADYEQAALNSAQQERGQRMGAVAQAQNQGLGSEAAYTDQLTAIQGGADRERMAGLQRAASNEDMRMGALSSANSMASQRSATEFGQDFEQAQAQDELNKFNAGEWNAMERYNNDDRYRAFDAQMGRADRIAGQYNNLADMNARRAAAIRQQVSNIGGGAARAIQAPGTYGATGAPAVPGAVAPKTSASPLTSATGSPTMDPAMAQQQQLQTGDPLTTSTKRKFR